MMLSDLIQEGTYELKRGCNKCQFREGVNIRIRVGTIEIDKIVEKAEIL